MEVGAVVVAFVGALVVAIFGIKISVKIFAKGGGTEVLWAAVRTGRAGSWRLTAHVPTMTDAKARPAQNVACIFFDIILDSKIFIGV